MDNQYGSDEDLLHKAHAIAAKYMIKERRGGGTMLGHCIHVATELAHAGQTTKVVCAGMLHDVVEDGPVTISYLNSVFGGDIGRLVDVLTKKGSDKKHERRYLLRLSVSGRDPITIKLVDNTHNLEGCLHLKRPAEYVKYGKKIQAIGAKILGENNPFVLKHLRALRSAESSLTTL